jgi:hypothetical protein
MLADRPHISAGVLDFDLGKRRIAFVFHAERAFRAFRPSEDYRGAVERHFHWTRGAKDPQPVSTRVVDATNLEPSLKARVKAEGMGAFAFIPLTARVNLSANS